MTDTIAARPAALRATRITSSDNRHLERAMANGEIGASSNHTMMLAALVAAVCGALYRYDTGIISGALFSMKAEFSLDHTAQEIITAAILAGVVISALATSWLSDRWGRKVTVMAVALLFAIGVLLGCLYVDRIGRRRLMLVMIPGSVIGLVGLGSMFALGATGPVSAWLTIAFPIGFMLFNSGGIQVCSWLLWAELFPLSMRGQATAMLWGSNLAVTGTALPPANAVGLGATMWIYAAINFASFLFVLFLVPETAGASLEDIEAALRNGWPPPPPTMPRAPSPAASSPSPAC